MVVTLGDVPRLETRGILVELGVLAPMLEIGGVLVKLGALIHVAVALE